MGRTHSGVALSGDTVDQGVVPLPPGPNAPAAWQLLRYSQSPLSFLEECARRHGDPFTIRLAGYGTFVMLASPEAVKDVFRGDPHALHSGEGNEFLSATVGSNSVLVLDDEPHAQQRRALLPPLKGERMRSFFDAMQAATLETVRAWSPGQKLGMVEPMQEITLKVMLQVVLGLTSAAQLVEFAGKVRRVLELGRGRHGLILLKILPVGLLQRTRWLPFYRQMHDMDEALFAFIKNCRQKPVAERGENVLADLLEAFHEDGKPLTDQEIRDALVTLIFAGHDTTSVALAWVLEQTVPRADVVQRITDELRRTTGGRPPRADQLNQLAYLDATIRESLRIRTIMPFVVRLTKTAFTAGGREYPAGVVLCPCSHLVHRRVDLYPEPETFRPDRFLERHYAAHEWFPFGGGNRMCLGMAFALYEMKVVLSTLFATVRLARPPGRRSAPVRRGIALAPDDGALMVVA
ncbi:MAG: cytochrome P450 [Planctomycetaceae bacterium]